MKTAVMDQTEVSIAWKQFWSLTALYASIIIGWIAYEQYQPRLLVQFNFQDFAVPLAIAQGIILSITPLVAGKMGDRYRFTRGNRIPIISGGISFAAMIFMSVAFTLITNPGEVFKWVLPVLIILWLIAMSIFTSPALSTIETFIPIEKLPRAMAILTITGNLLYSLEPVIADIIDFLGAPVTFISGGVIVFASGLLLKRNALSLFDKNEGREGRAIANIVFDTQRSAYWYILVIGMILGIATSVLFHVFPALLQVKLEDLLNDSSSKIMVVGILVVSGLLALPFSYVVNLIGLRKSVMGSTILTAISIAGVALFSSPLLILLLLVIFSIGFTALSVSTLPLAMAKANYYEKVFCVGIFFAGVAIPDGILEVLELL